MLKISSLLKLIFPNLQKLNFNGKLLQLKRFQLIKVKQLNPNKIKPKNPMNNHQNDQRANLLMIKNK
jgi:hypothetical protein